MIQAFYCTTTHGYTNIRSCRVKLVTPTRAIVRIYTLVNCTIKLTLINTVKSNIFARVLVFAKLRKIEIAIY